ncbi:MAG TPA: CHAD domain-containing protein [Ktedonobacterales bacterium]|nr:CHAD domain-containing protein [Ktedonobacterales bacterium]
MGTPAGRQRGDTAPDTGTPLGRQPLRRIGTKALQRQLWQMRENVAAVCEGSDAEGIHQMRVATRRLRTMARVLETTPTFRRGRVSRLRKLLQPLANRLGAVRDLDILLQHLSEYERTLPATGQTSSPLYNAILQRREKALDRLRQTLQQPTIQTLLRHPRGEVKRLVTRRRSGRRLLVRHVTGSALWTRYEAILSYEDAVAGAATTRQLHALRIACKQLRYALELSSEDSDARARSLQQTLKDTQDHLGDLQDCVFAVTLLTRLRRDQPSNQLLEGFRAAQESRQDILRQGFAPVWERISGDPYRRDLAALIAAL